MGKFSPTWNRGRILVRKDGIGQVVTLKVPAGRLLEVNLVIENHAWGAYRTEFYPTYDLGPFWP